VPRAGSKGLSDTLGGLRATEPHRHASSRAVRSRRGPQLGCMPMRSRRSKANSPERVPLSGHPRGRDLSPCRLSPPTSARRSGGCEGMSRTDQRRIPGRASTARAANSCRSASALEGRRPPHTGRRHSAATDRTSSRPPIRDDATALGPAPPGLQCRRLASDTFGPPGSGLHYSCIGTRRTRSSFTCSEPREKRGLGLLTEVSKMAILLLRSWRATPL
jgi:hypothetical protein